MNNFFRLLGGGLPWTGWRLTLPLGLLSCLILCSGCESARQKAMRDQELLARHPAKELRISKHWEEGYEPAGVWRIRGPRATVYLAGTCHVLTENEIPFPSPFYAAYQDSEEIYLEMETSSPSFLTQLRLVFKVRKWVKSHQAEAVCPKGRKLGDYLSTNTVARLKAHYGKEYAIRERFTPLFAAFLGGIESMAQEVNNNGGVDETFELMARRDGKPIHALDDNSVLDSVTMALDSILMDLSLDIARRGADRVIREEVLGDARDEVINFDWRRGDLAELNRINEEMKREYPALYAKLLPERNRKWIDKIQTVLRGDKDVMVLAGAAHMGGEDGLVQLLEQAGYTVEQMYGVDRPLAGGVEKEETREHDNTESQKLSTDPLVPCR